MPTESDKSFFQPGGSLPPDARTYVKRPADDELFERLLAGDYCHILTARQVGKSSLRVRVSERLQARGVGCVSIDLTAIGSRDTTVEQWYYSIVSRACRELDIDAATLRDWWREHLGLSPVERFQSFIEAVLLEHVPGPIVVFIDEIDSIVTLHESFSSDDFFAVIRYCFNSRADNPAFKRLTFAVLGVATPDELMKSPERTPFNISIPVEIGPIRLDQAGILINGLATTSHDAAATLSRVFYWTAGQPYLTQKLCDYLVRNPDIETEDSERVDRVVDTLFFDSELNDHNLKNVNNRLLLDEQHSAGMLETIARILSNGSVDIDDSDFSQTYLKLSGLVITEQDQLVIANPIYQRVFDHAWLQKAQAKVRRPFAEDLKRWFELDKPASAALRGEVLEKALNWAESRDDLTPTENEYLNFSQLVRQQERENEIKAQYASSLKRRNRILAVLLFIAMATGGIAVYFSFVANEQARVAEKARAATEAQREIAEEKTEIAERNERLARAAQERAQARLEETREALISLHKKPQCRIATIDHVMSNPELLNDIKADTTNKEINAQLSELENSIKQSLGMGEEQYVAKITRREIERKSDKDDAEDATSPQIEGSGNEKKSKGDTWYIPKSFDEPAEIHAEISNFTVSEEVIEKYPSLINLILKTDSIDDEERQYWFEMLDTMELEHTQRLFDILQVEKQKLKALEIKYQNEIRALNEKHLGVILLLKRVDDLDDVPVLFGIYFDEEIEKFKSVSEDEFTDIEAKLLNLKPRFQQDEFYFLMARFYGQNKKHEQALSHVKQASAVRPNNTGYLTYAVKMCRELERLPEARRHANQALGILRDFYQALPSEENKNREYAELLMESAELAAEEKDLNTAIAQIEHARSLFQAQYEQEPTKDSLNGLINAIWYQAHYHFDAGQKKRATSIMQERVALIEDESVCSSCSRSSAMASTLGSLSWYALFTGQYQLAVESAQRGFDLKPEKHWIMTNAAHGLLLQGKFEEAKAIYLKYNSVTVNNGTWTEAINKDFTELRAEGIEHPDMDRIAALLNQVAGPKQQGEE